MRLIDADALVSLIDNPNCRKWFNRKISDSSANWARFLVGNTPTVDALVLPCKIGDDVYIIPSKVNYDLNVFSGFKNNNRVYHQKVAEIVFLKDCWYVSGNADKAYGTGNVLLDRFFKETWFLTREEAEAALAKMNRKDDT